MVNSFGRDCYVDACGSSREGVGEVFVVKLGAGAWISRGSLPGLYDYE